MGQIDTCRPTPFYACGIMNGGNWPLLAWFFCIMCCFNPFCFRLYPWTILFTSSHQWDFLQLLTCAWKHCEDASCFPDFFILLSFMRYTIQKKEFAWLQWTISMYNNVYCIADRSIAILSWKWKWTVKRECASQTMSL